MNNKLKQELKEVFNVPLPTRKIEFLKILPYPKVSNFNIFLSQILYIRKRFWTLSILFSIGLLFMLINNGYEHSKVSLLSSFLPVFTMVGISEISRSFSYNMIELEMSCKFNLQKIIMMRLVLIGSFYFIIFLFLTIIATFRSEFNFSRLILYSITPFLVSSYLSLAVMRQIKTNEFIYICSGITAVTSFIVMNISMNFKVIYEQSFVIGWRVLFIAATILLIYESYKIIKKTEELPCHLLLNN